MTKQFLSKIMLLVMTMMLLFQVSAPIFATAVHADGEATFGDDFGISYGEDGIEYGDAYGKDADQASVWNTLFTQYKGVIIGVTGIATLTMVALFIFNFMKLGQSAGNPQQRSMALTGLLWTGLAAAGLGGVTIFVGFSQNLLKGGKKN